MLLLSTLLAWGLVFLFPGPPQKSPPSAAASSGFWSPGNTLVMSGLGLFALLGFFATDGRLGGALWFSGFYGLGVLCAAGVRGAANFLLKRFAPGSNSNAGQRIAATTFCAPCLLLFFDTCYVGYMSPFAPTDFILLMPTTVLFVCCLEMARWFLIKLAQARNEESKE
jgi:hypothetical protein